MRALSRPCSSAPPWLAGWQQSQGQTEGKPTGRDENRLGLRWGRRPRRVAVGAPSCPHLPLTLLCLLQPLPWHLTLGWIWAAWPLGESSGLCSAVPGQTLTVIISQNFPCQTQRCLQLSSCEPSGGRQGPACWTWGRGRWEGHLLCLGCSRNRFCVLLSSLCLWPAGGWGRGEAAVTRGAWEAWEPRLSEEGRWLHLRHSPRQLPDPRSILALALVSVKGAPLGWRKAPEAPG